MGEVHVRPRTTDGMSRIQEVLWTGHCDVVDYH